MIRYNCPNCGAGITGERCQYCGTVIYDFAAIQTGAPSYVKIMHNGAIYMFRMIVDDLSLRFETQTAEVCGHFGIPLATYTVGHTLDVSLNAHCVPMDTGGLMTVMIKEEGQ